MFAGFFEVHRVSKFAIAGFSQVLLQEVWRKEIALQSSRPIESNKIENLNILPNRQSRYLGIVIRPCRRNKFAPISLFAHFDVLKTRFGVA
jgi:hypothetical protein